MDGKEESKLRVILRGYVLGPHSQRRAQHEKNVPYSETQEAEERKDWHFAS